jgi:alkylresorcinol/alkylpyrone synthase
MTYIHSIATYNPPNRVTQEQVKELGQEVFGEYADDFARYHTVFENTQISSRTIVKTVDWYHQVRTFTERNSEFYTISLQMSVKSANLALERANLQPSDIDILILVTSSGFVTPTLDASIIEVLGLNNDILRIPFTGLGCAGGVYGLSRATELSLLYPDKNILFIAVETCTLTFRPNDKTKANIIALSLFGDGSAALVLSGRKFSNSICLKHPFSYKWKDSLSIMGWKVNDDGLQVVFDKSIPELISKDFKAIYQLFLEKYSLKDGELSHLLFHPGGAKVLKAFESVLERTPDSFTYSWNILKAYGNMSSPTVLYVIQDFIEKKNFLSDEKGLLCAMGPGFSTELLSFETT